MPLNAEPDTDSVQFSKQKSEVARHHINEQSQKIDSDISITSHMHTSCCMLRRAMCKCVQACNSHIATKWQLFITHATISRFLLFLGRSRSSWSISRALFYRWWCYIPFFGSCRLRKFTFIGIWCICNRHIMWNDKVLIGERHVGIC